jgi:hypothetical protein
MPEPVPTSTQTTLFAVCLAALVLPLSFSGAAVATCYCFVVLLVLLPIRFIGIEGRSPVEAGLLMMALSGPMVAVPTLAARLANRLSSAVLSAGGLLVASAGLFWLALLGEQPRPDRWPCRWR